MPVIGFRVSTSAGRDRRIAKGLQEAGYIEVRSVAIEISLGRTTVMAAWLPAIRQPVSRWHAAARPEPKSVSAGSTLLHFSIAFGQRGWKRQPAGGSSALGTSPLTIVRGRLASTSGSATGIAANRASV